ncbi:MAG: T9SS type A sorting domain-containing protein [Bacteroidota bacterium]
MKKQIYTILANVASCAIINAQVTLTQANHAPVVGDVNNVKEVDTTANIRSILNISGNGVTWDFTGTMYSNGYSWTDTYVNPSTLPGAALYTSAGANVALSDSGGFYKSSNTKLEYLGDMSSSGEVFDFTSNPGDLMRYPFSYGTNYTDIGSGSMNAPGFPPFIINATITVNADGQGTLLLPSNPNVVYNNVLKVHSYVYMLIQGTGTLSAVTGTQTIDMFDFYVSGQKFPVFFVHYQRTVIPAFGTNDFHVSAGHIATITLNIKENSTTTFEVYPNPSKDILYLKNLDKNASSAKIQIFNVLGEIVKTLELNNTDYINVSDLNTGVYWLQITKENELSKFVKFIKE